MDSSKYANSKGHLKLDDYYKANSDIKLLLLKAVKTPAA